MIGVGLVQELVRSVLLTGRVYNSSPVSLLLIAHPESGKTSIVMSNLVESAIILTDVTGRGLLQLCQLNPAISHFIVNDLTVVMSHKPTVNRYTYGILVAMTEEGVSSVVTPAGITKYESGKRGLVACCTLSLARDGRAWWNRSGFATRFLPFCYQHSAGLILKIKSSIVRDAESDKEYVLNVPRDKIHIEIPKPFRRAISREAEQVYKTLKDTTDELGYRRLKQYLSISQGHAILSGKTFVGPDQIKFLERIRQYISYDVPAEL